MDGLSTDNVVLCSGNSFDDVVVVVVDV